MTLAIWEGWDEQKRYTNGLNPRLIALQAEAIGVSLIQWEATWDTYEDEFKQAIKELKQRGINTGIFGDIDLQGHREGVEKACGELGIKPILPLRGMKAEEVLREFVEAGFETTTVDRLLRMETIHPCGESGECHTFVTDGPVFNRRLQIADSKPIQKKEYWTWDIHIGELILDSRD